MSGFGCRVLVWVSGLKFRVLVPGFRVWFRV